MNFEHLIPLSTQSFAFPMHVQQISFANDIRGQRGWKVVLRKEFRGQRSQFTQEGNLEVTLFDFENNFDHVGLRVRSFPTTYISTPPNIVDVMVGELITPTQILIEEMATIFDHDDDEVNELDPLPLDYESEWLLLLKRLVYFIHIQFSIKTLAFTYGFKLVMTIYVNQST
jgi:hypothetical protein